MHALPLDPSTSDARPARRVTARRYTALTTAALVVAAGAAAAGVVPASAATSSVTVDFSESTGAFQGGASGMLYGLSDEGVPTDAIIAGAKPTNITQKAPHGAQHPNGDPLEVEDQFFRNGGEYLMTNIQDYYPDWSYNGGKRPDDFSTYLDIVRTVVTSVVTESAHPEKYVFVPFNEPDGGNWYYDWGSMGETYLADWSAVYETIKEVYPEAKIAGMGDTHWQADRTRDILGYAQANDVLPDMFTWHELGINNLATFRSHLAEYRQIEADLGIDPLPVNITEYAMRRDMSVPGQLVQWLAMFEDEKVDAQTAYWTYAGNLNDNMAKSNGANGAWWLLKWYGDLAGDTVQLTPPALNEVDTLQGIAALDTEQKRATVIFGGGSDDVTLNLAGLDRAVFGNAVDIQVRESEWTGQEGAALAPRIVASQRVNLSDGNVDIVVPNDDRLSAFQLVVTPALAEQPAVDDGWQATIEAEDTTLANVTSYDQPLSDAWVFAASNQKDVGSTNRVDSSLTWSVDVPADGTYRFGAIAGVNGPVVGPGSHALFVDGSYAATIDYEAGFSWTYRGRAETLVDLTKGTHDLSVRMSQDGTTLLPGSDVSLDKFDLTRVTGPDTEVYPAVLARFDGAVSYGSDAPNGTVALSGGNTAEFFVSVRDNGYYDLSAVYGSDASATVQVAVNGRAISGLATESAGDWESTARVHLAAGISRITAGSTEGINLSAISTVRTKDPDTATVRIEMEDPSAVALSGAARVEGVDQPTNVSGSMVSYLGDGAANTATVTRPAGLEPGQYDIEVRYSNAEKNTGHAYNTDVVSRFLEVSEAEGAQTRVAFRHNYSWKGFWTHTVPIDLTTDGGALTFGNATGYAPNVDWIGVAPLVLSTGTTATGEAGEPGTPDKPDKPDKPAKPTKPEKPAKPDKPVKPGKS